MVELVFIPVIAAGVYAPIVICLLWAGQEIATARIDSAKELGQTDLPIAILLLDFTTLAADREPFQRYFTRSVRRHRVAEFERGRVMPVRFNPLDGTPSPRPVHFRQSDYRRPARLWLIRGLRVWIVAAILSITLAALLAGLVGQLVAARA